VYVQRSLAAGACGYITKNSAAEILLEAIAVIMQGGQYVEKGLIKSVALHVVQQDYQAIIAEFSAREFDIFALLAQGLTVYKIADQLCLGHKTVANYATQIKKKLMVSTSAELAHIAVQLGLMVP
jgi:DNA-binding NarL/FixJ family response regulator